MLNKVKDNFKFLVERLWKDESAQGATEYILLLVAIVGLVTIFGKKLTGDEGIIKQAMNNVGGKISKFINTH